jgi:hypothetical protein
VKYGSQGSQPAGSLSFPLQVSAPVDEHKKQHQNLLNLERLYRMANQLLVAGPAISLTSGHNLANSILLVSVLPWLVLN